LLRYPFKAGIKQRTSLDTALSKISYLLATQFLKLGCMDDGLAISFILRGKVISVLQGNSCLAILLNLVGSLIEIMQNTRLNSLVDVAVTRSTQWIRNPWRRLSVVIIGILSGNFLATAISTTAGQTADWDILVSVLLVSLTEIVSWLIYRRGQRPAGDAATRTRSLFLETLNAIKLGLTYGLFVEAFKIGS
jgi:hypothetical protein